MTTGAPRPLTLFIVFLRLSLAGFGATGAQVAALRREAVERRDWLTEETFDALAAFCLLLPGAGSLNLAMAIGREKAGPAGVAAAAIGYLAPLGLIAITLGLAWQRLEGLAGGAWLHGVKVACAAIVLQGVLTLGRTLAAGPIRTGLAIGATVGLVLVAGPAAQAAVIFAGAVFGFALLNTDTPAKAAATPGASRPAIVALTAFALLLAGLPLLAAVSGLTHLGLASAAFRAGALAFGDGQLILPLLEAETHGRGWIGADRAVAGFGVISALPGPIVAYSGFIGAVQDYTGAPGGLGGLICLVAAALPGALLTFAADPVRRATAAIPRLHGALAGAGAVAVGVLAASLWRLALPSAVARPTDWALVAAAWIFLAVARLPAWAIVLGFAAATALFRR